jgi:hypothetical protein
MIAPLVSRTRCSTRTVQPDSADTVHRRSNPVLPLQNDPALAYL